MTVLVVVKNVTSLAWTLQTSELTSGTWEVQPPPEIRAMSRGEWRVLGVNSEAGARIAYTNGSAHLGTSFRWKDDHNQLMEKSTGIDTNGYDIYTDESRENDKWTLTIVLIPEV